MNCKSKEAICEGSEGARRERSTHRLTTHLQDGGHEHGAAHQEEDHEAGHALLSDAEELGLLAGRRALRLQLQAVDMGD